MTPRAQAGSKRRSDSLSRDRIVQAAIDLLDGNGEDGLTFRALAERLATGAGAIYWHVANKQELLDAASEAVLAHVASSDRREQVPTDAIRAIALELFDALDEHPWIGPHLARNPQHISVLRVFEQIGQQLTAAGVPHAAQFDAASALLNYILGVAGQMSAGTRIHMETGTRTEFLDRLATAWEILDTTDFPFLRTISDQLRDHDDRAQFATGVDLILAGIQAGL